MLKFIQIYRNKKNNRRNNLQNSNSLHNKLNKIIQYSILVGVVLFSLNSAFSNQNKLTNASKLLLKNVEIDFSNKIIELEKSYPKNKSKNNTILVNNDFNIPKLDNKLNNLSKYLTQVEKLILNLYSINTPISNEFKSLVNEKYSHLFSIRENSINLKSLVKFSELNENVINDLNQNGIKVNSKFKTLSTIEVPLNKFEYLLNSNFVKVIELNDEVAPTIQKSRIEANVDTVNAGFGDINGLSGKDVIVAVIDWGFDYTHPNFWIEDYSQIRVKKAWDQYKKNVERGYRPDYGYGVVYQSQKDLYETIADTSGEHGILSHGSHTAGIAAGSGFPGALQYTKGVAHNSDLIFITRESGPVAFADAVDFIEKYADTVGKPFVINMSFGGHNGPHDGTSLQNQVIDEVAGKGKIFIGSAGNNGNDRCHLKYNLQNDTMRTFVGFSFNTADYWGQSVIIWGEKDKNFKFRINATDYNGNLIGSTEYFSTLENVTESDTIAFNNTDTLIFRLSTESQSSLNGKCNAIIDVTYKGKIYAALEVVNDVTNGTNSNEIHLWNMIRQNRRLTNWGRLFFNKINNTNFQNYVGGDNNYTVGEPSGVGKRVISIGAFNVSTSVNGDVLSNNIASFSSRGPSADDRVKPDLAASGEFVRSSINSTDPAYNVPGNYTPGISEFDFNGKKYRYATSSGTSMSGPMVAGTVALLLELNPNLTPEDLKFILQTSTKQDQFTGYFDRNFPNNTWGTGKLNAMDAALKTYYMLTSIEDSEINSNINSEITFFPNPSQNELYLNFKSDNISSKSIATIEILDMNGKTIKNIMSEIQGQIGNNEPILIDISNLKNGAYFLNIVYKDSSLNNRTLKFIKQ